MAENAENNISIVTYNGKCGKGIRVTRDQSSHSLSKYMYEMYLKEEKVDVTVVCEGKFIKAHKVALCTSPYFQEVLVEVHKLTQHPILCILDSKYSDIKTLIDFMYTGEIEVCQMCTNLKDLAQAAKLLRLNGVSQAISTSLGFCASTTHTTPTHQCCD